MNDVATVCSGLIRLGIATRQIRSTRSTLASSSSSSALSPSTSTKKSRPTVTGTTTSPPSRKVTSNDDASSSISKPTSFSPPRPIPKPVHTEPIAKTVRIPPPPPQVESFPVVSPSRIDSTRTTEPLKDDEPILSSISTSTIAREQPQQIEKQRPQQDQEEKEEEQDVVEIASFNSLFHISYLFLF